MRIRSGPAKVGYIVVSIIVILLIGIALSFAVSQVAAQLVALAVGVALLVLGVRSFRGASEAVAPPRAWWRMTERPVAGYLVAIYFFLAGLGYLVAPFAAPAIEALYIGVYAMAVAAYVHSSIRLSLRPPEEGDTAPQEL
ncbi:hypothetical protein [Microbacterium rhizosphaerae]|uniref:Uncharacterized protein n=1 Tax=Microbacterium rhizosphaerae TaxID=1678237 RepID=A0ABZ0STI0_9MICO|nr:hypothetical protein [Microbacterium rhizosphaerae]WPR90691.1 hypothetical protein SM116_05205 [Microbacterium rhizosphaerae]